ncbi:MAG TPA: efflux RND transporter permease subunit [Bryobacteraceae bacterium]|nr:efflux RND transporter permease subunit [Bryobacteraceae bacterium]
MWIVQLALRRPYTFVVMALCIVVLGVLAMVRMPADIFPDINIPVVSVIWGYGGLSPEEMAEIITTRSERGFTTAVNDIEHMESISVTGISVIRIYFHPNARIDAAVSQLAAQSQSTLKTLPPGTTPPNVLRYNAATVPILDLGLSSDTLTEQEEYDLGYNFLRTQLATIQGASIPLPYGGRPKQVMIDINPQALYSHGLGAADVTSALNNQNLILPTGFAKIGTREYSVQLNNSPSIVDAFNRLPIKTVNGTTIFMRDVAQVRDGYAVQTNIVRHDGRRGALLTILKNGASSTLDVVKRIKAILPRVQSTLPPALKITQLFDQSVFVSSAISGVVREALAAALLTGLMILLFLGSWRSTLIVCISIPLSILTSLAVMSLLGETINIMTLGGMALAVGILVDDATVEIENIHRNLGMHKGVVQAILDGAQQIAAPAFVSTLCICIVFVPVIFLQGVAQYLFTPLALAVVLAMMASYLLSRTLIPTMVRYLIPSELRFYRHDADHEEDIPDAGLIWNIHHRFNNLFERMREAYSSMLHSTLAHRKLVLGLFFGTAICCVGLYPFIGQDFFPQVDAGQIRLHVRCPGGTRIEETEQKFSRVEDSIRKIIPPGEISDILDNIGLPYSGFNLAFSDSVTLGSFDGEILVSLKQGEHGPTWDYVRELRRKLSREYPDLTFFFQPADIVSQILNFGLPAPIDVQVVGPIKNAPKNYEIAQEMAHRLARLPGASDVHVHQVNDVPLMRMNVDRARASVMGLQQKDVANDMLMSLSSSGQVSPNWWVNPANNVDYLVAVQTPAYKVDSEEALMNTPVHTAGGGAQMLSNLAQMERGHTASVVNHYNVQPVYDVYANVQDRDLGSFAKDAAKVVDGMKSKLPAGSFFETRGQVATMQASFEGMAYGLIFAILLVYFLMVVNFQSWTDPFIILMALPGALAGILLMLFFTRTTISVPALMGAIMSIGVGTANSILLVTFANDLRRDGLDAMTAAYEAGRTRLRPVVMTAVAMLAGMVPMALGLGEGGEQNAPLGRAVIGGLMMATVATLFVVPVVYSYMRKTPPKQYERILPEE